MNGIELSQLQDTIARDIDKHGVPAVASVVAELPYDTLIALVMVNAMKRAEDLRA